MGKPNTLPLVRASLKSIPKKSPSHGRSHSNRRSDESDIEEAVGRRQALEEAKASNYNAAQIEKLEAAAALPAQKIASKAR